MTDLLARLKGVARSGNGWTARCPAHDDQHNSLSIDHRDGRWLIYCHAGCGFQAIIDALGIEACRAVRRDGGAGASIIPLGNRATAQPSRGRRIRLDLAESGRGSKRHRA